MDAHGASGDSGAPRPPARDDRADDRGSLALAFMLVALAGWVDAAGLVAWDGLYVSFMSGNTTELGAAPAIGDWPGSRDAGAAVLAFLLGVVSGELIGPAAKSWRAPVVVTAEAALLWLAVAAIAADWGDAATTGFAGLAMGVQTAAVHKAGGIGVALTYVTGTIVNLGRTIAAALRGTAPWRKALAFLGFWLAMLGGAASGAVVARTGLDRAMIAAAASASALAVFAGLAARRQED